MCRSSIARPCRVSSVPRCLARLASPCLGKSAEVGNHPNIFGTCKYFLPVVARQQCTKQPRQQCGPPGPPQQHCQTITKEHCETVAQVDILISTDI